MTDGTDRNAGTNGRERPGGRGAEELRPVRIEPGAMKYAEGSVLIEMGATRVLVAASVERRVPPFLRDTGRGWVTAEYAMLPRATHTRSPREVSRGRPSGRTSEIQRLIGRSLRSVVDLGALGENTITVDCDVIQADGGTRTAAVTGAYVALAQALAGMLLQGDIGRWPLTGQLAAVSVGVVGGRPLLDLEYVEDSSAEVDMNVVATTAGALVEVQGTGEQRSFSREEMDRLIDLALAGIRRLGELQDEALAEPMADVKAVLEKGDRKPAEPKSEAGIWGRP
jgi:ribonuclease PH